MAALQSAMAPRAKRRVVGRRCPPLFLVRPPVRGRRQRRTLGAAEGLSFLLLSRCSGVAAASTASGAAELLADWWPIGRGLRIREEELQLCLLDWKSKERWRCLAEKGSTWRC
jgi:hypothetical protein